MQLQIQETRLPQQPARRAKPLESPLNALPMLANEQPTEQLVQLHAQDLTTTRRGLKTP